MDIAGIVAAACEALHAGDIDDSHAPGAIALLERAGALADAAAGALGRTQFRGPEAWQYSPMSCTALVSLRQTGSHLRAGAHGKPAADPGGVSAAAVLP